MKVGLEYSFNDVRLDAASHSTQRQLSVDLTAIAEAEDKDLPLNLCLVLDRSGSMAGKSLTTVQEAALGIIKKLKVGDRISVVAFDHRAKVIVPNQKVRDLAQIEHQIGMMIADGGTSINEGMRLGIKEVAIGRKNAVSRIFLLTDGENEHGDNRRCLKLAQLASEYNITIDTLGFGPHWNQDVLEQISDAAGGTLAYIEHPQAALQEFEKLLSRALSTGLTNTRLTVELMPKVRLAELKPVAQVAPETIELPVRLEGNYFTLRLGDLMKNRSRRVLVNLYINQLPPGRHKIAAIQVCYDNPAKAQENLPSEIVAIEVESQERYQPLIDKSVQKSILTLAKYRQTQIAESKLESGDLNGAATMLQTAAKTALQLGDTNGSTILQTQATRLQQKQQLSQSDRKKTRLISKTTIDAP
ncbi:MAG: VWA domain-containing protein [Pleurocapsa sp.]